MTVAIGPPLMPASRLARCLARAGTRCTLATRVRAEPTGGMRIDCGDSAAVERFTVLRDTVMCFTTRCLVCYEEIPSYAPIWGLPRVESRNSR